jgi:hypothetical protein
LHRDVINDGAVAKFFRDAVNVNDEIGSAHVTEVSFENYFDLLKVSHNKTAPELTANNIT